MPNGQTPGNNSNLTPAAQKKIQEFLAKKQVQQQATQVTTIQRGTENREFTLNQARDFCEITLEELSSATDWRNDLINNAACAQSHFVNGGFWSREEAVQAVLDAIPKDHYTGATATHNLQNCKASISSGLKLQDWVAIQVQPYDHKPDNDLMYELAAGNGHKPELNVPTQGLKEEHIDAGFLLEVEHQAHKQRVWRTAKRVVDAEEFESARPPRKKQTMKEFLQETKPEAILKDTLGVGPNGLAGPSEAGKSLLVRDWAFQIAEQSQHVLLVMSEGTHDLDERFASQPFFDAFSPFIHIIDNPLDLVNSRDVDWLLDEYGDIRPVMVAFDVIYDMGMADDTGTKDVMPVFSALKRISKEWNAATLAIGHSGHDSKLRRFRGSSMWRQLFVSEWHMSDNKLTCEKSKIADKRELTRDYEVEYPDLNWPNAAVVKTKDEERTKIIKDDFRMHPGVSDKSRAERLMKELGLGLTSTRNRVRAVRKELETFQGLVAP